MYSNNKAMELCPVGYIISINVWINIMATPMLVCVKRHVDNT